MEQQQQQQEQQQQQLEDLLYGGGVYPKVYSAVMNLCDDAKDLKNRRWLYIMGINTAIAQHDALFVVAELEAILIEEQQQERETTRAARVAAAASGGGVCSSSRSSSSNSPTLNNQRTRLLLDANLLSEEAMEVFPGTVFPASWR
jgi:hypothetical protein